MKSNIAISVNRVNKNFYLPHEKSSRSLKSAILNVGKSRNRDATTQHALSDISFEIEKGEFFGILGRNGSGKSTLLKILAGIYQPTSGSVQTTGKLVPFIELGVGFNPELSGRENVYLNGALLGFTRKQISAMYDEIVRFAELEEFMDQKLKNYSSGMQVRLAFSVATHADADILLVDEVLAVGDADFQRKCFSFFKQLKKNDKTVVFVSHDMGAVREFCDRAVLVDDSKVIKVGGAEEISNLYSKLFLETEDSDDQYLEELEKKKNEGRFGNGFVTIADPILEAKTLTDAINTFRVSAEIKANRTIEGLVVGFQVKDPNGDPLCGTNTKIEQKNKINLKKGETITVSWSCDNIFADGVHTLTVAAHATDGVTMYDWWPSAAAFSVKKLKQTGLIAQPDMEIEVAH